MSERGFSLNKTALVGVIAVGQGPCLEDSVRIQLNEERAWGVLHDSRTMV